ncbi:MAG: hypothetical protein DMD50_05240 [Gemmatimonadetes bacterium]|nr:MAG: hypothetical protein DMD50_05240 [Gemmatimonadota bacterium]
MPVPERRAVPVLVRFSRYAQSRVRTHEGGERLRRGAWLSRAEAEIREIVNRETQAWDTQDTELLASCFHPAMVWPWPPTAQSHDPMTWVMVWGRFNAERWRRGWQELFDTHTLVHNRREIKKIVVSAEGDGAFAVVDIDTLWRHKETGADQHWEGRTCKIYTQVGTQWKMIAQTGVLQY